MSRERIKLKAIEIICNKLSERNAVLFLGAGINSGIKNSSGLLAPIGQELSDLISSNLLGSKTLKAGLDQTAEMARFGLGDRELNRYLYDLFTTFRPGTAHLTLVQLPWDVIYTTNFDLLIEEAAKDISIKPAGSIRPIFSITTDRSSFLEEDILYYKLHGCINHANTAEGRLILTRSDYRQYDLYRKPLFKRLEQDLLNRTFVFAGYALRDTNFQDILEDCRETLRSRTFPQSFAIKKDFDDQEEVYWREKYNIQLVEADCTNFLKDVLQTWNTQHYSVMPLQERGLKVYFQLDEMTIFPKIGESFYRLDSKTSFDKPNPRLFYCGAEPSWGDIANKIAPERDLYWNVFTTLFHELSEPSSPPSAYIITGSAGTGKTTLLHTLAYSLATEFGLSVLMHIPGSPLDTSLIEPLVDTKEVKRIIIVIKHAAEQLSALDNFINDLKAKKLPITLLLEERKNQWLSAVTNSHKKLNLPQFELGILSLDEIKRILDALTKYELLGKLTGSSRDIQIEHFTNLAHEDLLVALRELTSEGQFDDIIRDEFNKISSDLAKKAYVYVSALSQIDLSIRYETLMRIFDIGYEKLKSEIFIPTAGVLISGEATGYSRHNLGYKLITRHPIIASIIFAMAADQDEEKFQIFNDILTSLDRGYSDDYRLLQEITRNRQLVGVFKSDEKRRALYDRLESILPDSPYVLQHRSRLEKELNSPTEAVIYARRAVSMDNRNPVLRNTLGLALELEARHVTDPAKYKSLISEAGEIFDNDIEIDSSNPYGYIGKVSILRQAVNKEIDGEKKAILQANALSFLEEAHERTNQSPMIAQELAYQKQLLGDPPKAITILRTALRKKPNDERLRDMLIRLEFQYEPAEAIKTAEVGQKLLPTSWRMQRHLAHIKRANNVPLEAVRGHYEAAIRHHRGDLALLVELGSYLFMNHRFPEAKSIFNDSKSLNVPGYDKYQIREYWLDKDNNKVLFSGKVGRIAGHLAFIIAIPDNFEACIYRTYADQSKLKINDPVKFHVGFNAHGAVARLTEY